MSQTILILDNPDLIKIYHLNLVTYTGTNVIERKNAEEAIELLNILPDVDLIITSNSVNQENSSGLLLNYIKENKLDTPLIVIGKNDVIKDEVYIHEDVSDWETVVKIAANSLGVSETPKDEQIDHQYVPIKIVYFFDIDHTPCDVYIRIKKSPVDYRYIKRIHEQDNIKPEEIDKYLKQGLQDFYIKKDYQQYFVVFVTNTIMERLETDLDVEERIMLNSNAFEIAKDHLNEDALSEEMQELIYACIKSMTTSIKESPNLANLLQILFRSKISYAFQKAHLTCVIGNFIISQQKWYEERHLELLTYLSFLSDITLKSVDQIKITSDEELKNSKLSKQEKDEVIHHALKASKLAKEVQGGSEYLETLVRHHHGAEDGVGFPKHYPETLHPINKVFLIADQFVKMLLDPASPKNKKDILTILYARFDDEYYTNIIKILQQKMI